MKFSYTVIQPVQPIWISVKIFLPSLKIKSGNKNSKLKQRSNFYKLQKQPFLVKDVPKLLKIATVIWTEDGKLLLMFRGNKQNIDNFY